MFGQNWIEDYLKAGNSKTPKKTLVLLSKHNNYRIRVRVAENRSTPAPILEEMAHDEHPDVRLAVANNPSTPIDLVYLLALDEDATVRHGLAEDASSPVGVLKMLAKDENAYVRCRANKTLEKLKLQKKSTKSVAGKLPALAWDTSPIYPMIMAESLG